VIWGSTAGMNAQNVAFQDPDPGPIQGLTFGAAVELPGR
jgi:hypothetical protein